MVSSRAEPDDAFDEEWFAAGQDCVEVDPNRAPFAPNSVVARILMWHTAASFAVAVPVVLLATLIGSFIENYHGEPLSRIKLVLVVVSVLVALIGLIVAVKTGPQTRGGTTSHSF
jgi:hypothetical protein